MVADCPRGDAHRWPSLERGRAGAVTLRVPAQACEELVESRIHVANEPRVNLLVVFPGAVGGFYDIDRAISPSCLVHFSPPSGAAWLAANRCCDKKSASEPSQHMREAPAGREDGDARATVTLACVAMLRALHAEIDWLERHIAELPAVLRPDRAIFTSQPCAGTVHAAALLAEIGDRRARVPDAGSHDGLAGVTTLTTSSGRHRSVSLRWAAARRRQNVLRGLAGDTIGARASGGTLAPRRSGPQACRTHTPSPPSRARGRG